MKLSQLLQDVAAVTGDDPEIGGVAMDHRLVGPRHLFLACAGARVHGLEFLDDAVARGAAAVAWEPAPQVSAPAPGIPSVAVPALRTKAGRIAARYHDEPSRSLDVIGVTGTNGKTSVTHIIAHALAARGRLCGIVGTVGNGLPGRLAPSSHTTPDAVTTQRLLAGMRNDGADAVAMEVSSHALDQGRVDGVHFRVAVFTNLTRDHLDYHPDLVAYGHAKARLFESAEPSAGVYFVDDAFGRELIARVTRATATAVGTPAAAPRRCAERFVELLAVSYRADGLSLTLATHAGAMQVESRLVGHFNAVNLALAAGVLLELGVSAHDAAVALSSVPTVPGRMEAFGGVDGPLVVVDYAHTPDALEQVLRAARAHCSGRLICVFGCGGERDRGKRPLMGAVAAAWADESVVTDDNPRGEDGDAIAAEVLAGFPAPARVRVERDRGAAIASAIHGADAGDVVVVAGKGHEDYQIVGSELRAYSDRATVAAILAGRAP